MISTLTQLTFDLDSARASSNPTVVVDSTGRQVIFYQKVFYSGRTSLGSRVTSTPAFQLNIDAGTGVLNGVAISWNSTVLFATPNTFQIVYVSTVSGPGLQPVQLTTAQDMTTVSKAVVLAYVNTGNFAITGL